MYRETLPKVFAEWEAAGGVENNFRKHLLGIGAIKPTSDDLKFLADECDASVTQLRVALKAFPFR